MKKRVLYFDFLNIFAAIAVITMHINGMVHLYSDTLAWKQALVAEVAGFWAVPMFLMLSGATLMGYRQRYTTKEFFKKRFVRALIPFVIWSFISMFLNGYNVVELGVTGVINKLFFCEYESVYWFFMPLFSVYLSMPVVSLLKDNRRILWYMVGGAFALYSFLPLAVTWVGLGWNGLLQMPAVSGYLMYPVLGYLLSTMEIKKVHRIGIYIAGLLCAVFRYVAVLTLSQADGAVNRKYFDDRGFYAAILAVAVFVFVKNSKIVEKIGKKDKLSNAVKTISGCSFGVYLIHMHVINQILWRVFERDSFTWRTAGIVVTYLIALSVTFCKMFFKLEFNNVTKRVVRQIHWRIDHV